MLNSTFMVWIWNKNMSITSMGMFGSGGKRQLQIQILWSLGQYRTKMPSHSFFGRFLSMITLRTKKTYLMLKVYVSLNYLIKHGVKHCAIEVEKRELALWKVSRGNCQTEVWISIIAWRIKKRNEKNRVVFIPYTYIHIWQWRDGGGAEWEMMIYIF